MLLNHQNENAVANPIAIYEKELFKNSSFQLETFELCTVCGARFGIGHFGGSGIHARIVEQTDDLPRRLLEILAKDHRQERQHKCVIELDQ